jgi:hypothetical protein
MTGDQAAALVGEMCLEKRHALNAFGTAPVVCIDCARVMERLRAVHRDEQPPMETTTVHFVINPADGRLGAVLDEPDAHAKARAINGLVVSWPASGDYRKGDTDTP